MSFFTKKNFLYKLIICICIVLALMNLGTPQKAYAKEPETGGALLAPVCDLLLGLGDAVMNVLQKAVMGTNATLELDNTKKIDWGAIVLWVVVIAIAVAATIITAGGVWAAIGPMLIGAAKVAALFGAICLVTNTSVGKAFTAVSSVISDALTDVFVVPTYNIGPEEIFSGKILLFDANIFNPKEVKVEYNVVSSEDGSATSTNTVTLEQWNKSYKFESTNQPQRFYYTKDGEEVETSVNNSAYELRNVISRWYYIIRTIALVGSMLVLLYIGIRILISSIAEEKAKYKQMLGDWVIALCLIFLMHYIMIFAHNIAESITNLFGTVVNTGTHVATVSPPEGEKINDVLVDAIKEVNPEYYDESNDIIKIPTNLMGRMRVDAQNQNGKSDYVGYVVAYLVLVIFTLTFSFTYIKRLLYLLFLTVIAPFVALTYPMDKIHDGKAQAFDMWLKEYIFNLLIQPFHLLLYTIFVSMAIELSSTNIIYTLVVLGFMMPAEKFLRTMFGFNKASTPGMLGGAAGAAMAMSAVNSLGKFAKGGHGGKDGGGNKDKDKDKNDKIRMPDSGHSQQDLFGEVANENQQPNNVGNTTEDNSPEDNMLEENMPGGNGSGGNPNSFEEERNRLAAERRVLEEFEREQLEAEERLRQQELASASVPRPEDVDEPTPQLTQTNTSNTGRVPKPSIGRRLGATGKLALRTLGTAGKDVLKAAPGTALRMAGNLAAGATLGAVGLAAGIASGDPSKVLQNTTAGAGAGIALSNGIANRASSSIKAHANPKAKEQWEKDAYGSDYKKYLAQKQDDAFMKDKQIRKMYKEKLKLDDADVEDAMNAAKEYRSYGINDNNIIIKAMSANDGKKENWTDRKRIAAASISERTDSAKDLKANMELLSKTKGITKNHVDDVEGLVRTIKNL